VVEAAIANKGGRVVVGPRKLDEGEEERAGSDAALERLLAATSVALLLCPDAVLRYANMGA